jgi:hypothetical protein
LDVFGNSTHEYNLQGHHPNFVYWPIPLSNSQQRTLVITARAETQEDSHTHTQSHRRRQSDSTHMHTEVLTARAETQEDSHTHTHTQSHRRRQSDSTHMHTEVLTVNDFTWDMLDFRKRGELILMSFLFKNFVLNMCYWLEIELAHIICRRKLPCKGFATVRILDPWLLCSLIHRTFECPTSSMGICRITATCRGH